MLHAYEGASFLVIDPSGDVQPGREAGLYHEDTRFLSMHTLTLGGAAPIVLSARTPAPHLIVVFATNPALPGVPHGVIVLRRVYHVGSGLHADVEITSYASSPIELALELSYDADFIDVFQVKAMLESPEHEARERARVTSFGRAILALAGARDDGWSRRTEVRFSSPPEIADHRARFSLRLAPGESFELCQDVFTIADGNFVPPRYRCTGHLLLDAAERHAPAAAPPASRPALASDDAVLAAAFQRALDDLVALEVRDDEGAGTHLAAGVPWFMALFGRDSLIAAYQAMAFLPALGRDVLRSLARGQGKKVDPVTEEQPGKILHEYRRPGLHGARAFVPRFPYYGSVDATPLFVIVLAEYWRTTGDLALLRSLSHNLDAAVSWIEGAGDPDGDGFLEYHRTGGLGLLNQGWKDSEDSVRFRDGRIASGAIALVEVQGYACAALEGAAELRRALGLHGPDTDQLVSRAAVLREAIDRAFWIEDAQRFALALDGDKRPVDALTSNPAHLLWAGAALPARVGPLAEALLGDELFSGFGVRTMGSREAAYSPISYHNGSVWPHDTSIAAAGLARSGHRAAAARVCQSLLDAVEQYQDRRLPELFAGFARDVTPYPVEYPTSNSPQAWAAGAMALVVTTMLGLELSIPERRIRLRPALPERVGWLELSGLPVAGASVTIRVERAGAGVACEVHGAPDGFAVDVGEQPAEAERRRVA